MKRLNGRSRFRAKVAFEPLTAGPMIAVSINAHDMNVNEFRTHVSEELAKLDADAVVQIRLSGPISEDLESAACTGSIRSLAPETMNVTVSRKYQCQNGLARTVKGRDA